MNTQTAKLTGESLSWQLQVPFAPLKEIDNKSLPVGYQLWILNLTVEPLRLLLPETSWMTNCQVICPWLMHLRVMQMFCSQNKNMKMSPLSVPLLWTVWQITAYCYQYCQVDLKWQTHWLAKAVSMVLWSINVTMGYLKVTQKLKELLF